MAICSIQATLPYEVKSVWRLVTSLKDFAWRTDLRNIEILDAGKQFVEYTKDGYATKFTITACEPHQRYAFDLENENMCGHWTGTFTAQGAHTTVVFTENITAKKVLLRPFVKMYLKKQQATYLSDLTRALQAEKQQF